MNYKCCYCDNTLTPQGPIMAMISGPTLFKAADEEVHVNLDKKLKITNLHVLNNFMSDSGLSHSIKLDFQKPIQGKLENFQISNYQITPKGDAMASNIVICCDNCKKCCSYTIE